MKKYLFSIAVMAIFAIGFAASDETESSSSSNSYNSSSQTEKKQETEAERKTREKKEKIEKAQERGKFWGKMAGRNITRAAYAKGEYCKDRFISEFGTPSTEEDFELYTNYFKPAYCDAYDEVVNIKSRM